MSEFPREPRPDAEQERLRNLLTGRGIHLGEHSLIVKTGHRGHPVGMAEIFLPEGIATVPIPELEEIAKVHDSSESFLAAIRKAYAIQPR